MAHALDLHAVFLSNGSHSLRSLAHIVISMTPHLCRRQIIYHLASCSLLYLAMLGIACLLLESAIFPTETWPSYHLAATQHPYHLQGRQPHCGSAILCYLLATSVPPCSGKDAGRILLGEIDLLLQVPPAITLLLLLSRPRVIGVFVECGSAVEG